MNMPKFGRPAIRSIAIRQALREWTGPIGMSHRDILDAVPMSAKTAHQVTIRLRAAELIFALGERKDRRYFATEAARDGARAEFEAHMVAVLEERKQKRIQAKRDAAKHSPKPKRLGPISRATRHSPRRIAIASAIVSAANPIGLSSAAIALTIGAGVKAVRVTICHMREEGKLFSIGEKKDVRYFMSEEARDGAAAAYKQFVHLSKLERIERAKETARRSARKSEAAKTAKRRAEKAAAVDAKPKVRKPNHKQMPMKLAKPKSPKVGGKSFKDLPVVNAGKIKPKVLPGFTGDRWGVSGPVIGGFVSAGIGRYLDAA